MNTDIPDWHKPRNEACPHNEDPTAMCACSRFARFKEFKRGKRKIKSRWKIKVNDPTVAHRMNERLVLEVRADGKLIIRESKRRISYETTVGKVYSRLVMSHAIEQAQKAKRERASNRKAAKMARRLAKRAV